MATMSPIEAFLKEARAAKAADLVINNTLRQTKERSKVLNTYVPLIEKTGRDWLAYIGTSVDPIASLVATGQDYPEAKKGDFSRIQARNFKAAISYHWDEDTQWRMQEVSEIAKLRNITIQNIQVSEGKVQLGQDNELAKVIFGSVASLVRGHINLIDYLAWQTLQTGKMAYTDRRTGLNVSLNWLKALPVRRCNFPFPVYQTDFNGTETVDSLKRDWTQHETADPLQDLVDMHANYKYVNGFPADEIAISERLMLNMVRCKSVKEAVVAANVIGNIITGTPSIDQLNEVMTRRFLPKFVLVDDRVEITDETGASIPTRVLDEGTIVFLSRQAQFNRILGGTLENGGKSGIYVNTYTKAGDPPLSITNTASMQLISAATISKTGSARKMAKLANLEASENLAEFTTFNPADGLTIIS
jgi:hypothetical protein